MVLLFRRERLLDRVHLGLAGVAQFPKTALGRLAKPRLVAVIAGLYQHGAVYGGDNVGESGLTIERIVPRSRLKPRRGLGWQPV